ncbi:MAG: two-component system response regulator [Litorivivens sp.]|jgi:two-component system response regulator
MNELTADFLIVEDNPHDAELTLLVLRKQGLAEKTFVVRDGEEACEFLFGSGRYEMRKQASQLKFILLDLKLPKLNGFEVLERIRAKAEFDVVPVIVYSSSAVPNDIAKAYKLGANSYLVKPIGYKEHTKSITDTVDYWLNINITLV